MKNSITIIAMPINVKNYIIRLPIQLNLKVPKIRHALTKKIFKEILLKLNKKTE